MHRDVMGPSFVPHELHVTYGPPTDATTSPAAFGCNVLFGQSENRLLFDAAWLDATPQLGNKITFSSLGQLCDELIEELQLHVGFAGKVREILLVNLAQPTSFNAVAKCLKMSTRTLRRRLLEENTSYRDLIDELRMNVAIKYLRDTEFKIEDIADFLGFSGAANFRHAFHRWTERTPQEFRRMLAASSNVPARVRHRRDCPYAPIVLLLERDFGCWCSQAVVFYGEVHRMTEIYAAEDRKPVHAIGRDVKSQACMIGEARIMGKLNGVPIAFNDLIK